MKKLLFIILFLPVVASAQNSLIDSLKQIADHIHYERYQIASEWLSDVEPKCQQSEEYEILFQYCFVKSALMVEYRKEYGAAMPYIQHAIEIAEKVLGIHTPEYVQLLWAAGYCLQQQGDIDGAIDYMYEAYIKGGTVFKTNAELLELVADSLAQLYEEKNNLAEVKRWYLTAQNTAEKCYPKDDDRYYAKLYFLVDFYSKQGHTEEAIDIVKVRFANRNNELNYFYKYVIDIYLNSENRKNAYPYVVEYKPLCKDIYGENSEEYGNLCNTLFAVLFDMEEFDNAEKALDESAKSLSNIHGENSIWYAAYLHNKGSLCMKREKYEEAKNFLLKSIELQEQNGQKAMERTVNYLNTVQSKL
ncbi:tetratricopeptide repeat protein [Bacteroides sp. OttesenSCG-928-J23]|nr:tetratricopeptide repeat protein [Bacteroides sp. OttesenSCG-928-J23]MDL2304985.1 tetratricopeptide repeat protein [Bacteroides sp. OttesenSCG-928-D19]